MWNQFQLSTPATAACQLDTKYQHYQGHLSELVAFLSGRGLRETLELMNAELALLKRFLYKLSAVFRHDKSLGVMKQILKCVTRFMSIQVADNIDDMVKQYTLCDSGKLFVPPRPRFEFILVRFQGAARLLAQTILYCQHCIKLILARISIGHFVNIHIISVSMVARIWASSFHIMGKIIDMYSRTKHTYSSGILPDSKIFFLTPNFTLPDNLTDWLKEDPELSEIHHLIRKAAGTSEPPLTEEILQEIKVDDDELDSLQELKSMVSQSANKSSSKNTQNVLKETAITDDELDSLRELKDMFSKSDDRSLSNNAQSVLNKAPVAGWTELDCDLGELVSRTSQKKTHKKKEKKKETRPSSGSVFAQKKSLKKQKKTGLLTKR